MGGVSNEKTALLTEQVGDDDKSREEYDESSRMDSSIPKLDEDITTNHLAGNRNSRPIRQIPADSSRKRIISKHAGVSDVGGRDGCQGSDFAEG